MDKIDKKLITLLQNNARMPLKALAENVFLSSPAVSARIERLEKEEIIEGYGVLCSFGGKSQPEQKAAKQ